MRCHRPETTFLKEVVQLFRNETDEWIHVKVNGDEISKTVAGPEKVGRYKGVRIDVEVGGSGKTNIHMTAQGYDKMYYSNGTFPTAPTKLAESQFVKKGLAKAFDYINRKGLRFP